MTSPTPRFALRIESGERAGERIEVPPGGLDVGRRPGSGLALPDGSVSGRHARVELEGDALRVRDLGSRNGTRVAGERIEERRLAHGDAVEFGAVRCIVVDAALDEPAADAVGRAAVERAGAGGRRQTLLLVLLLAVAAGAGAWWWTRGRGGDGVARARAVPEVAGNLLADGSFEDVEAPLAWESSEEAPRGFRRDGAAAASGRLGLGADLEPGEWALARSPAVPLRARRSLALSASLAREGGAEAAAGIELADSSGARPPLLVFAEPRRGGDGFAEVELSLDALPGYDEARAFVAARARGAAGAAALDDVALLEAGAAGGGAAFRDTSAWLPDPPLAVALVRASTVVLAGRAVPEDEARADEQSGPSWPTARLAARAAEKGLVLEVEPLGDDPSHPALVLAVDPAAGDGANGERSVFAAAIGPDGFRASTSGLARAPARELLFGRGIDRLRVAYGRELEASARPAAGGLHVVVPLGGAGGVEVRLDLREERVEAGRLADRARGAERRGEVAAALAAWSQLLDEVPYEAPLVAEAEEARARILQRGHDELDQVRRSHERARFFGLPEMHRADLERAREIAAIYAESGVEARARALAAEIEEALDELEAQRGAPREERLLTVLEVARRNGWSRVASIVEEHAGSAPAAAPPDAGSTEEGDRD